MQESSDEDEGDDGETELAHYSQDDLDDADELFDEETLEQKHAILRRAACYSSTNDESDYFGQAWWFNRSAMFSQDEIQTTTAIQIFRAYLSKAGYRWLDPEPDMADEGWTERAVETLKHYSALHPGHLPTALEAFVKAYVPVVLSPAAFAHLRASSTSLDYLHDPRNRRAAMADLLQRVRVFQSGALARREGRLQSGLVGRLNPNLVRHIFQPELDRLKRFVPYDSSLVL